MLAGLGHGPVGGGDHEDGAVHLGRAGDHVLDVVRVARAVDVGVVARAGLVLDVGDGDGDAPLALLGSVVDGVEGAVLGTALERQVLGDGRGQRRLAVVDVPDGAHVDVGLGALELLLGHRGFLTTPVQGFASRSGLEMEPTLGFEPKTSSLPRKCSAAELCGPGGHDRIKGWWAGRESNPHSRRRLIYSQRSSPPAQPTHGLRLPSETRCLVVKRMTCAASSSVGADDGTRTRNRRFTKPLLYQLSYVGGDVEGYRNHAKACNDIPGPIVRHRSGADMSVAGFGRSGWTRTPGACDAKSRGYLVRTTASRRPLA